jgi:hypothetical protein
MFVPCLSFLIALLEITGFTVDFGDLQEQEIWRRRIDEDDGLV